MTLQALEGYDTYLTGRIFQHLAETQAELAGKCKGEHLKRRGFMSRAEYYNDRAEKGKLTSPCFLPHARTTRCRSPGRSKFIR